MDRINKYYLPLNRSNIEILGKNDYRIIRKKPLAYYDIYIIMYFKYDSKTYHLKSNDFKMDQLIGVKYLKVITYL